MTPSLSYADAWSRLVFCAFSSTFVTTGLDV